MLGRTALVAASVLGFAVALPLARGAEKSRPALDEILRTLQDNLDAYDRTVPSFFCDEHAVSQVFPGTSHDVVVTDSLFRLRRDEQADHSTRFAESRELKTSGAGPNPSASADAPAAIDGIFEGALAVVSANQQGCMRYDLRKSKRHGLEIDFRTVEHAPHSANCLLDEKAYGRAVLDPATLQIRRFEMTAPHHLIHDDQRRWAAPLKGEWVISVDYASVLLEGKAFWMPVTINSRVTSDPNTFHSQTWLFKATYSNFHRLEVTSRVVPAVR